MIESLTPEEIQNLFDYECVEVEEESFEEFKLRYEGFGSDFYQYLYIKYPLVFQCLRFYKAVRPTGKCSGITNTAHTKDSYAHFLFKNFALVIGLDPETPQISIHNYKSGIEVGYWIEKPFEELNAFIENEVMPIFKN